MTAKKKYSIRRLESRSWECVGAKSIWFIQKSNSSYGNWTAQSCDYPNQHIFAFRLADLSEKIQSWEAPA